MFQSFRKPLFVLLVLAFTLFMLFSVMPTASYAQSNAGYPVTVINGFIEGNSSEAVYIFPAGAKVNIRSRTTTGPRTQPFIQWIASPGVKIVDVYSQKTSFIMPANAVTVTAYYGDKNYLAKFIGVGEGSYGHGIYSPGATASIYAGTVDGAIFKNWTSDPPVSFANANDARTTFTMPAGEVTITANFVSDFFSTQRVTEINSAGTKYYYAISGSTVYISAGTAPAGTLFKKWADSFGVKFDGPNIANTSFIMPWHDVTVEANYEKPYYVSVISEGTGAYGSGYYFRGEIARISAGTHPKGYRFQYWESTSNGSTSRIDTKSETGLLVPSSDYTLKAIFGPGASITIPAKTYTLTVENGKGSGKYEKGAQISIKANKAPAGKVFDKWVTSNGGKFADKKSASTTFTMPGKAVTVTATYKNKK